QSDRHYLWAGRISGFVITMLGVLYAMYLIESVLYTFLLTETLATFVGISVLAGIVWPRANRWGAIASLLVALIVNFALYYATGHPLNRWAATFSPPALVPGWAAPVAATLLPPREPAVKIEAFSTRLRRSSDDDTERPLVLVNVLNLRRG